MMNLAIGSTRWELWVLGIGLFIALLILCLFYAWREGLPGQLRLHAVNNKNPEQDMTARINALERRADEISAQIKKVETQIIAELRALAGVLAQRETEKLKVHSNAELRELEQLYMEAAKAMEPLMRSVNKLRPSVLSLAQYESEPGVTPVLSEYEILARMGEQTEMLHQETAQRRNMGKTQTESLALAFQERTIPPHEYLASVYANAASSQQIPVSTSQEKQRLEQLAASIEARFLSWIDSVSELRDVATAGQRAGLHRACSQVISQAGEVLECWDVRLIDVPVGSTRFDSRLHDLYGTVPRTDVSPETVIAVRKLGHRKGGVLVRKPQVLVASASS